MTSPPSPVPDLKALHTSQEEFSNVVKRLSESVPTDSPRIDLLFLRFLEHNPDEHTLAEIIRDQIVNYALPLRKRLDAQKKLSLKPGDISLASRLFAEARDAFIAYNATNPSKPAESRYSEIGEVIAFCVASHFLEAGQVAAKMALKTNSEMPVFGLDGIHVRAESDNTVTVFFLEAKMVEASAAGSKQYAASAAGFAQDRKHKLNEKRIARDLSNLDILPGAIRNAALDYFDPYGKLPESVRERFVGVIIYNEPAYQDKLQVNDATPITAHEAKFTEKLAAGHPNLVATAIAALTKAGADPGQCRAFYIAVPEVANLKRFFAEAMSGGHIR